jgi:hypothetical protein
MRRRPDVATEMLTRKFHFLLYSLCLEKISKNLLISIFLYLTNSQELL